MKSTFTILLVITFGAKLLFAQSIESVIKAKPFKLTGGISAGGSYLAGGKNNLISPLGYNISARLNAKIYGVLNIPISYTINQNQRSFSYPQYSRFGVSPSYKWITIHAGHRSYVTSPYLSSGISLLGGGIDLRPGKFRLSAFYGKVNDRIISNDNLAYTFNDFKMYTRKAYGGTIGVGSYSNRFDLSVFKAYDDRLSGNLDSLKNYSITPKENLGISTGLHISIKGIFLLEANAATSIVTSNVEGEEIEDKEGRMLAAKYVDVIKINQTSTYGFAYDAKIGLNFKSISIGYKYQHIDPYYTSLGLSFIQPDINNHLIDMRMNLFRSKLNLFGSLGLQSSNTKSLLKNKDKRLIGNLNLSWNINNNFNLNLNYNNFNASTKTNVTEVRDSLVLSTNNVGYNANVSFKLPAESGDNRININFSKNNFDLINSDSIISNNTSLNGRLSWNKRIKKSNFTIGANLNYSRFDDPLSPKVSRYGFGIRLGKKFSKKIRLNLMPNFNFNKTESQKDGYVFNIVFSSNYRIDKKTNINFYLNYVNRKTKILNKFSQMRISSRISRNL